MNRNRAWISLAALALGLAGCAASPSQTSPPSPAQPVNAPAVEAPAATTAPAAAQAADGSAASAKAADKPFMPPTGFKARKVSGNLMYCRSEVIVGTRLPKLVCYTQEQVEDIERRSRTLEDDVSRSRRVCSTIEACASN